MVRACLFGVISVPVNRFIVQSLSSTYRGTCRSQECAVKLLHLQADDLSDEDMNAFQDDIKRLAYCFV